MRSKTEEIYQKLCKFIPGGVNSPVRACLAVGQLPLIVKEAFGDKIYDVDGKGYIDYCGSWGPLIHGHTHPEIVKVLQEQILKGTTYGATSELEAELAEKVIELVPSIEQVRFVSSGTEATMSAIRLARGFTGRNRIIKFSGHYHGHADFLLVKAGSGLMNIHESTSKGIPEEFIKYTLNLPFNCIESLACAFHDYPEQIACVILEPIAGNMGVVPATQSFMEALVEITKRHNTLLIFDEVMTGFRVAQGGAQSLYSVKPDLTCLGKIIGGGLPAAAFGGRRDIMQHLAPLGSVYQAGTLSGNPLAMAAGLKSLEMLSRPSFYEELNRKTDLLTEPIQDCIAKHNLNASLQRSGSMFTLFFGKKQVQNGEEAASLDFPKFAHFFRTLFNQGIYIPPLQQEAWFISMAHQDHHLKLTADIITDYLTQ